MTTEVEEITIPDSPAALAEFLNEPKHVQWLAKENKFGEFINKYASVVMNQQLDIKRQVQDEVEKGIAAFLRDQDEQNGARPVAPVRADGSRTDREIRDDLRRGLYNPRAKGAVLDKHFQGATGLADFFNVVWHNGPSDADTAALRREIRNAFTSTEGAGGGFLIPEILRSEILRVALESSVVRSRARVVPMESLKVSFPAIDSTSNVSSVHGGIVSYWEEEGATHTDSSPSFQSIALQARKLVTYTEVPNELMADNQAALQMFLGELFPEALTFDEDHAFLSGDGVGKPLGALKTSNNGTIEVAAEAGQEAGTIYWENIIKMYSRMLPASINRAVWVVSTDVFPELATMALNVGTGGVPVWLPNGTGAPTLSLLGRPIIATEKTPAALGTRGDISFVDFGFYLVGDRQMMSASSSEHVSFNDDKTAFKIVSRCDGRPWLQNAITPRNNAATLGACVQLATRS